MAIGCKLSGQSAAALEDEITRISSLSSLTNCKRTYEAIEGIMNGTLKVLLNHGHSVIACVSNICDHINLCIFIWTHFEN